MTPEQLNALVWFIQDSTSEPNPSPGRWRGLRTKLYDAFHFDIDKDGYPVVRKIKFCEDCGHPRTPGVNACRECGGVK